MTEKQKVYAFSLSEKNRTNGDKKGELDFSKLVNKIFPKNNKIK